jgi:hypothetical protein
VKRLVTYITRQRRDNNAVAFEIQQSQSMSVLLLKYEIFLVVRLILSKILQPPFRLK